jgi:serine/threonine-protein kinase RsbW
VSNVKRRPGPATLRLCVAPDPRQSRVVREQIVEFATTCGVPDLDAAEFVTAVSEAFANAVEHAGSREPITVACTVDDHAQLVATIVDRGTGFPPDRLLPPVTLPDAWAERGRGLPLMRRYSDHLAVRSAPGEGTTIEIARSLRYRNRDREREDFLAS